MYCHECGKQSELLKRLRCFECNEDYESFIGINYRNGKKREWPTKYFCVTCGKEIEPEIHVTKNGPYNKFKNQCQECHKSIGINIGTTTGKTSKFISPINEYKKARLKTSVVWQKNNPVKVSASRKARYNPDLCNVIYECPCDVDYKKDMHHPDYSKPYDVVLLCKKCHSAEHRRIKLASKKAA